MRNSRRAYSVDGVSVRVSRSYCRTERARPGDELRRSHVERVNEEVEVNTGVIEKYRRHSNGRGLVSPAARVHASAFVSSTAYVESGAQVSAESWIGPGSWIDHGAVIGSRVFIGQNVHVGADAQVGNGARLGSHSRIGRNARIPAGAVLDRDVRVSDNAVAAATVSRSAHAAHGQADLPGAGLRSAA
ncbi:transferase [Cryobacterium algoritolerans]|uniref:Transferase n=1 Tax=Cryobacterium algoritolerans TaxID=1259184 RepID=A0A4R8WKX8_9MICO|nr:transferase [Cryobacterium algoritolerans]